MIHYTLEGSHYEIGLAVGTALAGRGVRLLDQVPFPITQQRLDFAQACLPHYLQWFPAGVEELRGLARGQNCPFPLLAGVLFSMYCLFPQAVRCSCFAMRAGAGALFGRNSDFLTSLEEQNSNHLLRFSDGGFSFNGTTTAFVEMEDGVNQNGLAVGLTSAAWAIPRPGLNAGMILRLLLESCTGVSQALDLLSRLPIASGHTLVLADRTGDIALVECCPERLEVLRPDGAHAWVCAVNSFHLPEMAPYRLAVEDSWQSEERYQTLVRALSANRGNREGAAFAKRLLGGELGFLCQYDRASGHDTVWSTVYDAASGELWRAEGNPGRTPYRLDRRLEFSQFRD